MKITIYCFLMLACSFANAQQYVNGTMVTGPVTKSGIQAGPGLQWAELQHDVAEPTVTNLSLGTGIGNPSFPTRHADDFTIPAGETWHLSQMEFFGTIMNTQTSTFPFNYLGVEIWNGEPTQTGSVKIYGDILTNILDIANSGYTMTDHIHNTSFNPDIIFRPIWRLRGNVDVTLPAGTYWIYFRFMASMNSATVYAPYVIVEGKRTLPHFNAKYQTLMPTVWHTAEDVDSAAMDYPFRINYSEVMDTGDLGRNAIQAYVDQPNGMLMLKGNALEQSDYWTMTLCDMRGLIVMEKKVPINGNEVYVDISALQSGLYIVRMTNANGVQSNIKIAKH